MMQLPPALQKIYDEVDKQIGRGLQTSPYLTKPRIGVTAHLLDASSAVARAYTDALIASGTIPVILPITQDTDYLLDCLSSLDGLLLTGGADIHPMFMGEEPIRGLGSVAIERDEYELQLIRIARRLSLPILGICRGHQMLAVAYGSILYQDLPTQHQQDNSIDHAPQMARGGEHHRLIPTSWTSNRLVDVLGLNDDEDLWVNSLHHQGIRELFPPFDEIAVASDGINEAIDAYPELDILAVQWHPEQMVAAGCSRQKKLFEHLSKRASLYQRARAFHRKYIVLDSHTDTPMFFGEGFDIRHAQNTRVDLSRMVMGDVTASVMVAYLPQGPLDEASHKQALHDAQNKLTELKAQVANHAAIASYCTTAQAVREAQQQGKRAIIPAIENGYAIGNELSMLQDFKEQFGIAYITLTHNGDNLICDSACKSERTHGGLSDFGRAVIKEMNRLGIMIDVSHVGRESIKDILALSTQPIIASHSSARSLCEHLRNLTDEEIIAIAEHGGVIQVCLYAGFINERSKEASYLDAVNHIEHIISLVGVEHVGIGSDFDGDGELIGCRNSEDLIRITIELLHRGYKESELTLIWGGNFLRVWEVCTQGYLP